MITVHSQATNPDRRDERDRLADLRARLLGERQAAELADTFAVLGDPTRVRLVDALAHGELCVSDLAALVGLTESAVSHQLRLLRSLRLVRARRAGRQVYYQLDDAHIRTLLDQGRRHIEEPRAARG
jgi:DNA-binding transcriptional ArsR family regulator